MPRPEGGLVAVRTDPRPGVGRGPAAQRAHGQGRGLRRAGRDGAGGVLETGMKHFSNYNYDDIEMSFIQNYVSHRYISFQKEKELMFTFEGDFLGL